MSKKAKKQGRKAIKQPVKPEGGIVKIPKAALGGPSFKGPAGEI